MATTLNQMLRTFDSVFERAPLGVAIVAVDAANPSRFGRFAAVNDAFTHLTGRSREALLQMDWLEITAPQDRATGIALGARVGRREVDSFQLEKRYVQPDGRDVLVLLNASVLLDTVGKPVGLLTHTLDITGRAHDQAALEHREQQLAEAQSLAQLGSWEWDIANDVVTWSDELYRIFGLIPAELEPTFEGFLARVHPDDRKATKDTVQGSVEDHRPFELEMRVVRPDGTIRVASSRGTVVLAASGRAIRMVGTAIDVTAAHDATAALEAAHARMRLLEAIASAANEASELDAVLQTSIDAVCTHAGWEVGHVYRIEPATAGLVSSDIWHLKDPARYASFREHTHAAHVDHGAGLIRDVLRTRRPVWLGNLSASAGFVRADAAHLVGLRSAMGIPVIVDGDVTAILEFFDIRDVEPSAELERLLPQIGMQLQRVAERQRAHDQLSQARDAAMEASRLKSEFLAMMSHEIRTPMNGVIGLTGLLIGTSLDATQLRYAEGVQSSANTLLAIIDDILDFSKLEAGRIDVESVDFDPHQVVDEVAAMLSGSARDRSLELVASCDSDVPSSLRGDPGRIRQILINLTSNALKFTHSGEVVLGVNVVPGSPGELLTLRFQVTDTGIGIDEIDMARLFEPFSQADASTTRRYGGTGLGLAISRGLAEAMGGAIGVASAVGDGSTFWFTVPLAHGEPPDQLEPQIERGLAELDGLRVLVVDDNATNRLVLETELRSWGVKPEVAGDGPSALKLLLHASESGTPFRAALLDVCMAGMNGVELAQAIAADPAISATLVILLTSGVEVDAQTVRDSHVFACLTKPVRHALLQDTLLDMIAASARSRSPADVPHHATAPRTRTGRGTVLVAEDNALNQLVATGTLLSLGFDCVVVADGAAAVRAATATDFTAILMDCHMPVMDGYSACAAIRGAEGAGHRTPIIAMTAAVIGDSRQRCLDAGMDDFVAKPVQPGAVEDALRRWVGGSATAVIPERRLAPVESLLTAPATHGIEPVLDAQRLAMLMTLDQASAGSFIASVVSLFTDSLAARLASIHTAAAALDRLALVEGAHTLRGAAANVGATQLASTCADIEVRARSALDEHTQELIARLDHEASRAAAALANLPRNVP